MYSYKNFIAFMLFCILHILASNINNYGTFKLNVTSIATCKGPKRKDCTEEKLWFEDGVNLFYDVIVKEDIQPIQGKILTKANGKRLARLQMKKPCDNPLLKPLLMLKLNSTKDCVIVKGHYRFYIDIENIAHKYYGGMFLYGDLWIRSVFYSDNCNFSCTVLTFSLTPRNSIS